MLYKNVGTASLSAPGSRSTRCTDGLSCPNMAGRINVDLLHVLRNRRMQRHDGDSLRQNRAATYKKEHHRPKHSSTDTPTQSLQSTTDIFEQPKPPLNYRLCTMQPNFLYTSHNPTHPLQAGHGCNVYKTTSDDISCNNENGPNNSVPDICHIRDKGALLHPNTSCNADCPHRDSATCKRNRRRTGLGSPKMRTSTVNDPHHKQRHNDRMFLRNKFDKHQKLVPLRQRRMYTTTPIAVQDTHGNAEHLHHHSPPDKWRKSARCDTACKYLRPTLSWIHKHDIHSCAPGVSQRAARGTS